MIFDWWQWYILIGLLNYIQFGVQHRIWRTQGGFLEEMAEWAFFVFLWPVQLAYWVAMKVGNVLSLVLSRLW